MDGCLRHCVTMEDIIHMKDVTEIYIMYDANDVKNKDTMCNKRGPYDVTVNHKLQ